MNAAHVAALGAALAAALAQSRSLEFLLDGGRMRVESPLARVAPLAPVRVELGRDPPESQSEDGCTRVVRLGTAAAPGAPLRLLRAEGITAEHVPARTRLVLADLPEFSGLVRDRNAVGEKFLVVSAPLERTLSLRRCGPALVATLAARRIAGRVERGAPAPRVDVVVAGAVVASLPLRAQSATVEFTLPPALGTTEFTLRVADVSATAGRIAYLQTLDLAVPDGCDRVVLRAQDAARFAGALLEYTPAPPPGDFLRALSDPAATLRCPAREVRPVRGLERESIDPHVRHVALGEQTRRALLAPPPTRAIFPARLAAGDRLEGALGFVRLGPERAPAAPGAPDQPDAPDAAIGAELAWIAADGRRVVLLRETLRPDPGPDPGPGPCWQPFTVTLAPELAGEGVFEFVTSVDERDAAGNGDLVALAEPTLVHAAGPHRPSLLVCLVDTLRADHCTPWGYARDTTPALARLAEEGVLFERAYAQASWTRPSVATLFTSQLAAFHGAGLSTGLAPRLETLAELLRAAGFATGGFLGNARVHADPLNFEQGFSRFDGVHGETAHEPPRAGPVCAQARAWLAEQRDAPFFAYVHTLDPHEPYDPPAATRGTWSAGYSGALEPRQTYTRLLRKAAPLPEADLRHVVDLYDEEILHGDRELGALFDELRAAGRWDETIVVVLSDHGEEFFEHGSFGHGVVLWEELLRVPLIVKLDRREGENARGVRIGARVRVLDLLPTLLARLGVAPPAAGAMGIDLAAAFAGGELPELDDLSVIAEQEPDRVCFIEGPWKLIHFGPGSPQPGTWLYDLALDPREQEDLAAAQPAVVRQLEAALARMLADYEDRGFTRSGGAAGERLDEAAAAELKSLGYVGDEER